MDTRIYARSIREKHRIQITTNQRPATGGTDAMVISHDELCQKGAAWLKRKHHCKVVVTQKCIMTDEQHDVIGWVGRGYSWLIEVKVSRADFLKDKKKFHRIHPQMGMGDERYYLAPAGLIKLDELPDDWGLLEWSKGRIYKSMKAKQQKQKRMVEEIRRLVSLVLHQNHGVKPEGEIEYHI